MGVSVMIRRITLAALVAAFVSGSLALPASSKTGPVAVASKCKKGKKGKHKKKKKKCGSSRPSDATLPGQATHSTPTQPPPPPPAVAMSGISVSENPVLDGSSTSGLVTINRNAPSGGQPVTLQSDSTRVTVPANVVVAAGQTTAGFSVDTTNGGAATATLTASIGTSNVNTQLSVVPDPSVASVALQYQCFPGNGSFGSNRVTLDVPAPADTIVGLSTNANPPSLTLPFSTVTVPSGSKSALFGVDTGLVGSPSVMVTATLGPSSANDTASVRDGSSPAPVVAGVSATPTDVPPGSSVTGKVTLNCEAPVGGTTVTLHSDNAGVTVPATVVVPADALSVTFSITAASDASGDATITATPDDGTTRQTTVTVGTILPT
jgi:trimeric autotransporter adhesin